METKPKIALGAIYGFEKAIRKAMEIEYPFQTCINCINFDEANELCRLVKMRPPARVIAFGCPKYDDDKIPF